MPKTTIKTYLLENKVYLNIAFVKNIIIAFCYTRAKPISFLCKNFFEKEIPCIRKYLTRRKGIDGNALLSSRIRLYTKT